VLHGSDINLLPATGSGTGEMPALQKPAGSSGSIKADDDLMLGEEDEDIGSSDSVLDEEVRPKKAGSSTGKGSDVTLGAGDSGINLKPSDSGLSLEQEPLDLGSASGVESLELPEDEGVIALETEAADQDQATQVKADNEFLLSSGETLDEEESDSGSQVIALEDSESFDQEAATMLKPEGALGEDVFQPLGAEGALEGAPGVGVAPVYAAQPVEAPYSTWNVVSLGLVAGMLALSGMMMVDVMLNMWSFSGTNSISTGLMDAFVSMIGM
jgi:hypothetical protein